jgi:hypothetical protein
MAGHGSSFDAIYSASTGRSGGPSSLSITMFGSAPAHSNKCNNSRRLGILSAHTTCSGDPIIGELELTFAPAKYVNDCREQLYSSHNISVTFVHLIVTINNEGKVYFA